MDDLRAEQEALEDAVSQPVGEELDARTALRVRADQIAGLRLRRGEGMLDGDRDGLDGLRARGGARRGERGELARAGRRTARPTRAAGSRSPAAASSTWASRSWRAGRPRPGSPTARARGAGRRPSPRGRTSTSHTPRGTAAQTGRRPSPSERCARGRPGAAAATACSTRSCPTTFTSSWRLSSSGGRNSSGPAIATPALSTRASSWSIWPTPRPTASGSVTSKTSSRRSGRRVAGVADGCEDRPPAGEEMTRRRLADPARRAGN